MKQRYSSLDVKVIAHELSNSLCSLRVANIYDLSTRIFLFKFQKPNHREQLLIDSGFRCHLTSFARSTPATPSPFVVRLRKFLKTRRVTSITQIGTDRIIELQFSDGLYRLYLEFYAGGNIILTDNELNILSLLRSVDEGPEYERVKVGIKYNLTERQNYGGVPELTKERVREGLQKALDRQQEATDKKAKKRGKDALRKALAVSITELPPMLVDHAFASTGFDSSLKPEQVLEDESLLDNLMKALAEAKNVDAEITSAEIAKGYIVAKKTGQPAPTEVSEEGSEEKAPAEKLLYEDFHPFKPKQFEADPTLTFLEFEGFNKTVDEFFSSIEGQKLESRLQEREENAKRKLEQAKQEHLKRLGGLQRAQELNIRKAEAIQANVDRVQEAVMAVNGLIDKGMDWIEIDRLIEREQTHGNPVAQMIKVPLKLRENTVTLLLDEPGVEEDEEDFEGSETESEPSDDEEEQQQRKKPAVKPQDNRLTIDIDLGLSPWANAKTYFDQKKTAAAKEERTLEASQKALKSTQKKIEADLKKGLKQEKELLRPVRKQFWFEKFIYFISSDGYLVIGGKDAQQNEILYRRHLKKGDIYVHADLSAAAVVIIKNRPSTPDDPIPPSTLSQAGNLSVSTSTAWDSKAVMSAWWVNADQVSKTTSSGEYLAAGGFVINGKKNFLPPAQLLLGFAVMFQITEESKKNHNKHRLAEANMASKPAAPQPTHEEASKEETVGQDDASDSDEDFPDAKLESASDESDNEQHQRSNPLQSNGVADAADEGSGSGSELEEAAEEQPQTSEGVEGVKEEPLPLAPVEEAGEQIHQEPKKVKQEKAGGKRHLSARERRLLRKGVNPSELTTAGGSANESDDEDDAVSVAPTEATTQVSSQKSKQTPLPRGKRGKAKKMALKYAEQDEEERELALRLLGAKPTGKESAEPEKPKPSVQEELQAQKQRRREQHQRAQEKGKAEEERRRAALEGALGEDNDPAVDEEIQRLESVGLDAFTGRPLAGDELVAAIPVCAPWSALATYKYKVKLQPGAQKKGKAVKEILARWDAAFKEPRAFDKESRDVERIWPKEAELIKAWKETEVYGVVPSYGQSVLIV
ncbi:protein of unknown function DUF814 [Macrophomina phaseolina MS6]|uniref:Ribosome quality control complex subunit 2 n=1 Tax=Macrophomina phaseolina (strain MS6) TaxID=1126212 RepID=K2RFB8_MACPH|nr:protein of unknown function DUF814 [Macrophomina phaseolina MS6]